MELFWCNTCLVDRPIAEQSPDSRYCQGCYNYLLKEGALLSGNKRPKWLPKPDRIAPVSVVAEKIAPEKPVEVSQVGCGIMSTLKGKKMKGRKAGKKKVESKKERIEVDKIKKTGAKGRKRAELPLDFLSQLAGEGVGSKAIATRLKQKYDITVSYKTIQRAISRV